jgi:hypothetical protein
MVKDWTVVKTGSGPSYFHRDIGEAHLYDLVVNRAHTSSDATAELIAN